MAIVNALNLTISGIVEADGAGVYSGLANPLTIGNGGTGATSFTAGSVVFSNGSILTQDNSNLFWDDTNNRLGIGIITPIDTLHIVGNIELDHTASEADDHALEIVCDAAGFGDVKALDINYITGAIGATQDEECILLNIDETASTGGIINGYEVLTTTEGSATINGFTTGIGVNPIIHESGTFGDADNILNKAVDVTAALASGGAGNISIFVADNDTITIGDAATWDEMEIILDTGASGSGVTPTFEYSTGGAAYSSFSPGDGTNGFRNTGAILWDSAQLAGWATATSGEYEIRITRTKNSLSTTPIIDELQISSTTEYKWDKDGNLTVATLNGAVIGGTTPAAGTFDGITNDDISGSYADSEQVFKQAGVQTANATPTQAAAITLATNTMVTVEARFNGFIDDYSASCGGRVFYTARRVAGSAVEVGTPIVDVIEDSASAPTVDADVSGNDVRLLVTGVAAETWNWVVSYNYHFTKTNA